LLLFLVVGRTTTAADDDFPAELTHFVAAQGNPIFTGAGPGSWDVKIRERGWILREDDSWHLWYTGYDGSPDGIRLLGYAKSSDGRTWTRHPNNPLIRDHWVEDMMVVKYDDTYFMFAEGVNDHAQLLTSTDRMNWTRRGTLDIRQQHGQPLSDGPFGTPTAWRENDTWYLFYERRDAGVWLAWSKDLKVWTNVQDDPVIVPGPDDHDKLMIALNQIVKHRGRYFAVLHGTGDIDKPRQWSTSLATSPDLIHWKKYPGNPLVRENKSSGLLVPDGTSFRLYSMHERVDLHLPTGGKSQTPSSKSQTNPKTKIQNPKSP
jgi:predicted GH43/DUF377 family glycosyl hydrolase